MGTVVADADSQDAVGGSVLATVTALGAINLEKPEKESNHNQVYLRQNSVTIEPDTEYTIKFWIKSDAASEDNVRVQVYTQGANTGGVSGGEFFPAEVDTFKILTFNGDSTYNESTHTFMSQTKVKFDESVGEENLKVFGLQFGFAARLGTYYIDNILISKTSELGINDFSKELNVTIYPNPATDVYTFPGE